MQDRGEKIVSLAQEMLKSGKLDILQPTPENQKKTEKNVALKAACLAAIVAATGSAAVTHIMHEINRPATRYERVEIDALVFYAARQLSLGEDTIRREVHKLVGLGQTQDYSVSDYRRARNYLWLRLQAQQE